MEEQPLITVLMPTYKGAAYLRKTIDSILKQTFKNFELLIINDCSPDNTDEIISSYKDPRIRYIKNEHNLGISGSSNLGFSLARGKYIARQDHDDIAHPKRLQKQFEFMEAHPEVGLCGTGFKTFGTKHKTVHYPQNDADIKALLLFKMPLAHQTSMMRKDIFIKNNIRYDESFTSSNDRKLWIDASPFTRFHNLPDTLLDYRMYKGMTSQTKRDKVIEEGKRIRSIIYKSLGFNPSEEELFILDNYLIPGRAKIKDINLIKAIELILLKLSQFNANSKCFDINAFNRVLGQYYFKRCLNCAFYGKTSVWSQYKNSPLALFYKPSIKARATLLILSKIFFLKK